MDALTEWIAGPRRFGSAVRFGGDKEDRRMREKEAVTGFVLAVFVR